MADASTRTATLNFEGKSIDLPVYDAVHGPSVIDIRKLYSDFDVFTYDPGFTSTASCQSTITFIDGDKGELLYRGYPIDQLAEKSHFLEVCYILLYGELPSATQLEDFEREKHLLSHPSTLRWFREEHYFPGKVIDRAPDVEWVKEGSLSALDRARREVERLLAIDTDPHLDDAVAGTLAEIMEGEARRKGLASLPVS